MKESQSIYIKKVAVLGAGVMGAQIAAHLTNAGVPVVLFDLPSDGGNNNAIVDQAVKQLTKLRPSPLASLKNVQLIEKANYEDNLSLLADCDLVIEAIAERLDWKKALYEKIQSALKDDAILVTNTSGLSISDLVTVLPKSLHDRFFGVHFFNPPRYMSLVEVIPHGGTDKNTVEAVETFLTTTLGKNIIHAKDTPNFIANRIGVFSMLATLHRAEEFGIPYEVVDQLTGPLIGRAKSATYRTIDVVGLDTLGHVIDTMQSNCSDDAWHNYFKRPNVLSKLIDNGAVGQKVRCGFFKKDKKQILAFDALSNDYRPADGKADKDVVAILKLKDPKERLSKLRESTHPQAKFVWSLFSDLFHYCAVQLVDIAETARDIDFAMRWGYAWKQGAFELWQAAGWQQVIQWLEQDITDNKALVKTPLPQWVYAVENGGVHTSQGSYSPKKAQYIGRPSLPVYKRQLFPDPMLEETYDEGDTLFETDDVRLWSLDDKVGILSFKSKLGSMGQGVLEGIQQAVKVAEEQCEAMVIWQRLGNYFSVGANLKEVVGAIEAKQYDVIDHFIDKFQQTTASVRYARLPVVAAVQGYALGGGCELLLHCDKVVAALETYSGLVEVGVGLIPAGGGCKEAARRASLHADDPYPFLEKYYQNIAMGQTCTSACEGKEKGILRDSDVVVMHGDELLYVAVEQAKALASSGYRPPVPTKIKVAGRDGMANFMTQLVNYREGGFISEYDYFIGCELAKVVCGGDIAPGTLVSEDWILRLEREVFIELTKHEKTRERITHMLTTGKPLRN